MGQFRKLQSLPVQISGIYEKTNEQTNNWMNKGTNERTDTQMNWRTKNKQTNERASERANEHTSEWTNRQLQYLNGFRNFTDERGIFWHGRVSERSQESDHMQLKLKNWKKKSSQGKLEPLKNWSRRKNLVFHGICQGNDHMWENIYQEQYFQFPLMGTDVADTITVKANKSPGGPPLIWKKNNTTAHTWLFPSILWQGQNPTVRFVTEVKPLKRNNSHNRWCYHLRPWIPKISTPTKSSQKLGRDIEEFTVQCLLYVP